VFPQLRDVGEKRMPVGTAVPVPVSEDTEGDPGASCATVNWSARIPVAVGLKETWIVQLEADARVLGEMWQLEVGK
jgi:hypothetical protein